jgi:hypothetical protein
MSKSPILDSRHSFSVKISDKLTCRWSFRVSFICSKIVSDSFWNFVIILVFGSALGFSCHVHSFKLSNHSRTIQYFMVHSFTTKTTRSSPRAFLSNMSGFFATVTKG